MKDKFVNVGELRSRGVVKLKDKDMFSVWVKTACCNLNSRQLRKLADITEKYGRGYLLFTTRQIPIIPFIHMKDVESVQTELAELYMQLDRCGPTVRNVNVCYDSKVCPKAILNPLSLGEKLDSFFKVPLSHKTKTAVAGCELDCPISRVLSDIGFVAVERNGKKGYDAYVGGRLGMAPSVGMKMANCLSEAECLKLVQNYFDLMRREGKGEERSADLILRLGEERVREEVTRDLAQATEVTPTPCESRLNENETDKIILRVRATCGEVTAPQLRKIADIAERYGRGFVHFAVRGSPEIPCVDGNHLENIKAELRAVGMEILDGGIDNMQSCFGNYCTETVSDPQSLLRRIENLVQELGINNPDIKISASGCPNSCAVPHVCDLGFYGVLEPGVDTSRCQGCELCVPICKREAIKMVNGLAVIDEEQCRNCGQCISVCPFDAIVEKRRGFIALVGGKEGVDTRLGEVLAEFLTEDEAVRVTEKLLKLMQEKQASAADVLDEIGIAELRKRLVPNVVSSGC